MTSMIGNKTRLKIIAALKEKKELVEKRDHNVKEVHKLQKMAKAETNKENYEAIQRGIRKGQAYISIQGTELLKMSATKIADKLKVHVTAINYQWKLMNGLKL